MPSAGMIQPSSRLLVASNTVTATGNSATFVMPYADAYRLLLVTSAASGTTPTLDAVLQDSPDGGVTWVNLPLKFTQLTTVGSAYIIFKMVGPADAATAGSQAATGAATAVNCPVNVQFVRLLLTIAGTTPSFTYKLFANMIGRSQIGT
jgi:hypothetical protein